MKRRRRPRGARRITRISATPRASPITLNAIALDRWLEEAWGSHPRYVRIDNARRDWAAKSTAAQAALAALLEDRGNRAR